MMFFAARPGLGNSLSLLVLSLLAATALPGCGGGSGSQRTDELEALSKIPNKKPVAKFAGHVSVEGLEPAKDSRLFVILSDPEHPVRLAGGEVPKLCTSCDDEGKFTFTTYTPGDGVPQGKYVVTFVGLHRNVPRGRGGMGRPGTQQEFVGPDGLKNLYSDPEKNKSDANFLIEVKDPGKTDYDFNLSVAGKESVPKPSEYAVTHLKL